VKEHDKTSYFHQKLHEMDESWSRKVHFSGPFTFSKFDIQHEGIFFLPHIYHSCRVVLFSQQEFQTWLIFTNLTFFNVLLDGFCLLNFTTGSACDQIFPNQITSIWWDNHFNISVSGVEIKCSMFVVKYHLFNRLGRTGGAGSTRIK